MAVEAIRKANTEFLRQAFPMTHQIRVNRLADSVRRVVNLPVESAEVFFKNFEQECDIHSKFGEAVEKTMLFLLSPIECLRSYQNTFKEVYREV
jgi:hypothetical protein